MAIRPIRLSGPSTFTACSHGLSRKLARLAPAPGKQDGRGQADGRIIECILLHAQHGLKFLQAGILYVLGHVAAGTCCGRAGAGRVFEGIRLRKANIVDQAHRLGEVGIRLAGMAHDEIG